MIQQIERINYDYFIVDGDIVRPLGVGGHKTHFLNCPFYGDWTLNGKTYDLILSDLLPLLDEDFYRIKLSDIAWKGFDLDMNLRADNCICCNGNRFRECIPTMPGVLLEGVENPGGRKYRCLDGKHRIEALLSYEQTIGTFYILNMDHIRYYLNEYDK